MKKSRESNFAFTSKDDTKIFVYKWKPNEIKIRGVVQISHGMADTAARYKRFAEMLNERGFIVYANDHRGHGRTAGSTKNLGYLGDNDGFKFLVEDMAKLSDIIRKENSELPIYLFSYSMGSFATQRYIMDYNYKVNGVILCGTCGEHGLKLKLLKPISKLETIVMGRKVKSKLMNHFIFGGYNNKFNPKRTGFEWMTRDEDEQDKYMKALTIFPTSFYYDFLCNLEYIEDKFNFKKIPKDLLIFIISGNQDPVGDFGKGVKELYNRYKEYGVKDLGMKLYEGARHELLKETNRNEVMEDVMRWLEERI